MKEEEMKKGDKMKCSCDAQPGENHKKDCKINICPYCKGKISIANPTGKCNHAWYPENVNWKLNPKEMRRYKQDELDDLMNEVEDKKMEIQRIINFLKVLDYIEKKT